MRVAAKILPVLISSLWIAPFVWADVTNQFPQPVVGYAVRSGASRPVRFLVSKAPKRKPQVLPDYPLKKRQKTALRVALFDPVVQSFTLAAAMPGPSLNFEGLSNLDNVDTVGEEVIPPDPNGDIGPNHYVQTVNLSLRVFNKSTGAPLGAAVALQSLFTGFGGLCEDGLNSDPIVLYDPLADRWLISYVAFDADLLGNPVPPFHECVACSQSADPSGAYYLYDFQMPNQWLNDYPKFGVWPDAYYMTDNQFDAATEDPHGAGVFALDRTKMLAGDPSANFIYFDLEPLDPNIDGVLPADLDGPPPPAGTPNYMACLVSTNFGDPQGDGLRLFEFHADFVHPASSTFTERPDSPVAVAPFDPQLFCDTSLQDCIPQPPPSTATTKLDALSDRLMHRLQYRNFGSNESLVANHTVDVGGNHAGVRYYQLKRNLPGGSFFVNEQASFAPDANHRWMGSAAMDRAGNLAVGYSVSSTNTFPSIRYAGRLATDPPGGLFQGEATLQAGGGSQTDPSSRWGDYSMLAVDPADDCTFWYTTEYYSASSAQDWQTRIGAFKFAACSPAPKGTLQGTVTDATTSLPITNAIVRTADGFLRITSGAGTYSMSLPPAIYNITASALNHGSKTASGLVIPNGGTVTQNFSLPQVPVMTLISSAFSDAAGNNNGAIDPNECISFNVVLQNTGLITASNIVATLSTTTAGVTISQPVSAYPNAAVGVSRTNITPFQITTTLSLLCGAPIDLTLTVTHNGGTNEISIQLNTGEVGAATRFDATDTPVPIDPLSSGSSSITVSGITSSVAKVTVSLYMTSDDNSELDMYLMGPDGTSVALATSTGGAFGSDYGTACTPDVNRTTFDDAASTSIYSGSPPFTDSYRPEEMLATFNGKSGSKVNGTWTLVVGNFLATAELECWSLNISQPLCSNDGGACSADSIGDGILDSWRQQYFGSGTTTNGNSCASCDPDGDGLSNLQEFLAGTDPTNNASAFRITGIVRTNNDLRVTWETGPGKTNALERTAGGAGGSYATNGFAAIFTVTNTVGTVTNYLDLNAATNSPSRFYRVRLVP
jgi:hypothetical protein